MCCMKARGGSVSIILKLFLMLELCDILHRLKWETPPLFFFNNFWGKDIWANTAVYIENQESYQRGRSQAIEPHTSAKTQRF